jgi:hypothetical protein
MWITKLIRSLDHDLDQDLDNARCRPRGKTLGIAPADGTDEAPRGANARKPKKWKSSPLAGEPNIGCGTVRIFRGGQLTVTIADAAPSRVQPSITDLPED